MVCKFEDVNQALYICIPENKSMVNIEDNKNDVPLVTAETINRDSFVWKNVFNGLSNRG